MSYVEYRRKLPHWQPEGIPIFITWRLSGSLPAIARKKILISEPSPGQIFVAEDRLLDRASGPRWLRQPAIAALVADEIKRGAADGGYALHAWVIMPNHVHVLITPEKPLKRITQVLKGRTAREANKMLGLRGFAFWEDESWDRWVRSDQEFRRIVRYIEWNPVAAGLSNTPAEWPWSSATAEA